MAQPDLIIGKHTLESLTIGMYSDSFSIYREYVQNSTDAIDNAIKAGIISEKADLFNKRYRRDSSKYNSAVKRIDESKKEIAEIVKEIESGGITSDAKKEMLIEKKESIEKRIDVNKRELSKIIDRQDLDEDKKKKAELYVKTADSLQEQILDVENKIVNADYSTKKDLPSSYSKEERRIYQIVINVIDENVDEETAKMLRTKIREELAIGKKKGARN